VSVVAAPCVDAGVSSHRAAAVRCRLRDAQTKLKVAKRKDYYKILGVARDADEGAVKRAYHKAAKLWHPGECAASVAFVHPHPHPTPPHPLPVQSCICTHTHVHLCICGTHAPLLVRACASPPFVVCVPRPPPPPCPSPCVRACVRPPRICRCGGEEEGGGDVQGHRRGVRGAVGQREAQAVSAAATHPTMSSVTRARVCVCVCVCVVRV
jgi:hypothetical protein